jgi:hypothetical protein
MTDAYTPPPGSIQVLEWLPPQVVPGFPDGLWSLEATGEWLNPDLTERNVASCEGGMEADPETLGTWAAGMLGFPVRLTREDDVIGVAFGPFRPPFTGGNKITHAISLHWPHRQIPRRLYWVTPTGRTPRQGGTRIRGR